jgi:two-component system response regulator HydG
MSGEQVDILVVDDDISHCTILQALLRGWGYQVALAHNGLQALEQMRSRCLTWCCAISVWRRWTVSKR